MSTWPARFVVVDEDGAAIRTFWSRGEAQRWACCRGDMSIVVVPAPSRAELQRQMAEEAGEAVF